MSGPTLQLNVTAPGQKNVEASVAAVERLATALKGLPAAATKLKDLQAALSGGGGAGFKGAATDMASVVGELKNLGQQLNTSFGSLEETIKKGWAKAERAEVEGGGKVAKAKASNLSMLSRQALEQAEALSKAQAAGDRRRLRGMSGSEDTTRQVLYGADPAVSASMRSYYQGMVDAQVAGAAKLEAAYQASITKLDKLVPQVVKSATKPAYMPAGPAWWDEVLRKQEAATAKLEAAYQASIAKLDTLVPRVIKAATKPGYVHAGPAWWDSVLKEQESALLRMQKLDAAFAAQSAKGQARSVLGASSQLAAGISPAAVKEQFGSAVLAAAQATTFQAAYSGVHEQVRKVNDEVGKAPPKMKLLSASMSDAHSAARGLASGFGAMFLTWGRVMPLLAGAALSHSFVQSLKVGADVTQDLETMRVLSQESTSSIAMLENQLVSLGEKGPFGPRQVAEAMKVLSLAGLGAQQVSVALKPALDLAITGNTTIEKSASALVAVGTAYGYQAENFGLVGDAMAKAAAISMSSVDGMMESFRSASVVGQQYKVSLNDTATALALLANVGIRNSAAGTAVRQMYSELSGASRQTRQAMKDLGVQVIDTANGGMRPLLDIVKDLDKALASKGPAAYQRAIQDMSNERGAKALVALLEAYQAKAKEAGTTVTTELERIQRAIADAPGFAAAASAQLSATPMNQMKSVAAAFQTSLYEAFKSIEPTILVVSARLQEIFNGESFRTLVSNLATTVANASVFLLEHLGTIKLVVGGYVAWKAASIGMAAGNAAIALGTSLIAAYAAATGRAATVAAIAAGTFRSAWLSALGPIGIALGLLTAGMTAYGIASASASSKEEDAADIRSSVVLKSLDDEIERLDKVNARLRDKMGLAAAEAAVSATADSDKLVAGYRKQAEPLEGQEKEIRDRMAQRAATRPDLANFESRSDVQAGLSYSGYKDRDTERAAQLRDAQTLLSVQNQLMGVYTKIDTVANAAADKVHQISVKSRTNAERAADEMKRSQRLFGTEGITPNAFEKAAQAKQDNDLLASAKRRFDMLQSASEEAYSREMSVLEARNKNKLVTDGEFTFSKAKLAEEAYKRELASLNEFVANTDDLLKKLDGTPAGMLAQLRIRLASEGIAAAQRARIAIVRAQQLEVPKAEYATLPNVPKVSSTYVGTNWQKMLDEWKDAEIVLTSAKNSFMEGWIESGRSMWQTWLKEGKISMKSLGDLMMNTLADITYKRFIAEPMANAGNALFNTLLKPTATVTTGTTAYDSGAGLREAFSGLGQAAGRLSDQFGGLGQDAWAMFVKFGQGLAMMLQSSSSSAISGAGNWLAGLFGGSSGQSNIPAETVSTWANAQGNAFNNAVMAFANGGSFANSIVNQPTYFRFGRGGSSLGMMGEAGPEAVMPLSRDSSGSLGVRVANPGQGQAGPRTTVIIENHASAEVTQTKETQPDGSELIRVVLNATAKDVQRGGVVRKSMQNVQSRSNLPRY